MPRETFDAITESQIKKASIATLADRPNSVSRYGDSNLSAQELKERFDAFPYLVQNKINEIIDALASASASKYITLDTNSTGKDNLYDFIALFSRDASEGKTIADFIYALYTAEQAASPASKSISEIFNDMASRIAALESARVALQESVSNHETRISANETRISANESGIANHETRISANESGIANHETRISGIEQYLGGDNFIVDDSVAYQKAVPKNAVGKAKILKVGGMTYKSKNLIPFPYVDTGKTENGITWTINTDGSVTANGTATGSSYFYFVISSTLLTIPYDMTISGCPSGGHSLKYEIHVWKGGFAISDIGSSNKVPAGTTYKEIYAVVREGYTANNLTFKPMLNEGTTALTYEPYFSGLRSAKVLEMKSEGANKYDESKAEYALAANGQTSSSYGEVVDGVLVAKIGVYSNYISFQPFVMPLKAGIYTVSADCYIPTNGAPNGLVYMCLYSKDLSVRLTKSTNVSKRDTWERISVTIEVTQDGNYAWGGQGSGNTTQYTNMDVRFKKICVTSNGSSDFKPYAKYPFFIPEEAQVSNGINDEYYDYLDFAQKKIIKNVGVVDLEKLNFSVYASDANRTIFVTSITGILPNTDANKISSLLVDGYRSVSQSATWVAGDIAQSTQQTNLSSVYVIETPNMSMDEFMSKINGKKLYYCLAAHEVIDVSFANLPDPYIEVESGGTITAVNEHNFAAPSSIKYLVTYPKEV